MSDAFISYRRKPSASLALLIQEKLKNQHKIDAYVDTTRTDSTQVQFPDRLMNAIANAPVFICLLGENTLESEWVLKEIRKAHELEKFCIPIFQEGYDALPNPEPAVNYLLNYDGIHVFDQKNIYLDTAVNQLANLIPRKKSSLARNLLLPLGTIFLLYILTTQVLFGFEWLGIIYDLRNTDASQNEARAVLSTDVNLPVTTEQVSPEVPSQTPSPVEDISTSNVPIVTEELLDPAIQLALDRVTSNDQWTPYPHEFSDIEMVLVPSGCFNMGREGGEANEQPIHLHCFDDEDDELFWIDITEVTQGDFNRLNGEQTQASDFVGSNRPVTNITWDEAREFCVLRDARLPTEIEWEYAARGPSSLEFPWGDDPNSNNAVFAVDEPAPVGSILVGASWVGAMDMSGNVWEWTNSLFLDYPLDMNEVGDQNDTVRVFRGASWSFGNLIYLRSSNRERDNRDLANNSLGFRCARDFNLAELP